MKIRLIYKSIIILIFFSFFFNCTGNFFDTDIDSGFQIFIRNYSDKNYKGCKFYMGAIDANNTFITVDSLVYPDLVIFKKTEGDCIDAENGFSTTKPFLENSNGLNKFGYWEPKHQTIKELSADNKIHFKAEVEGKIVFNIAGGANGQLFLRILEDGSLSW